MNLAFEFMILTATRTSEVLGLPWNEISAYRDAASRGRNPEGTSHSARTALPRNSSSGQGAFTRRSVRVPRSAPGKPLSNMAFLMVLRRMGLETKITGHGFRSTFTDWAHETTNFPGLVVEMALNHVIKDKTEAAYRRGDLFEKRRELMLLGRISSDPNGG